METKSYDYTEDEYQEAFEKVFCNPKAFFILALLTT